jgi:HAD superfamily hydrolase (TIGR01549 family)
MIFSGLRPSSSSSITPNTAAADALHFFIFHSSFFVQVIRAIIFDFDGVILDSVDIKTRAFARLFEEHGPDVVRQVVAHHLANGGISRFRKFAHIYEHILHRQMPAGESERLGDKFSDLVFDEVSKAAWIPGAPDFLEQQHGRYLFFIASGTPQEELERIVALRDLEKYFTGIFGSPATKEQITQRVLEAHGLRRDEVVFVGDAMTDFNAAKASGVGFVGIAPAAGNPFPPGTVSLPDLRGLGGVLG